MRRDRPALHRERAIRAGRAAQALHRRLDHDRSSAAHRIDQRGSRLPAGERQQARRQRLAQRRCSGLDARAAAVQPLARRVGAEHEAIVDAADQQRHVRLLVALRRAHARHGVRDRQHRRLRQRARVIEAAVARARARGDRRSGGHEQGPGQAGGAMAQLAEFARFHLADAREHARGHARPQVCAQAARRRPRPGDAARFGRDLRRRRAATRAPRERHLRGRARRPRTTGAWTAPRRVPRRAARRRACAHPASASCRVARRSAGGRAPRSSRCLRRRASRSDRRW